MIRITEIYIDKFNGLLDFNWKPNSGINVLVDTTTKDYKHWITTWVCNFINSVKYQDESPLFCYDYWDERIVKISFDSIYNGKTTSHVWEVSDSPRKDYKGFTKCDFAFNEEYKKERDEAIAGYDWVGSSGRFIKAEESGGLFVFKDYASYLSLLEQHTISKELFSLCDNIQMFVTTESPIAISYVPNGSVWTLSNKNGKNQISQTGPTFGRDVNYILEEIFKIPKRHMDYSAKLKDIDKLMGQEKYEEAEEQLNQMYPTLDLDPEFVSKSTFINFWKRK